MSRAGSALAIAPWIIPPTVRRAQEGSSGGIAGSFCIWAATRGRTTRRASEVRRVRGRSPGHAISHGLRARNSRISPCQVSGTIHSQSFSVSPPANWREFGWPSTRARPSPTLRIKFFVFPFLGTRRLGPRVRCCNHALCSAEEARQPAFQAGRHRLRRGRCRRCERGTGDRRPIERTRSEAAAVQRHVEDHPK